MDQAVTKGMRKFIKMGQTLSKFKKVLVNKTKLPEVKQGLVKRRPKFCKMRQTLSKFRKTL